VRAEARSDDRPSARQFAHRPERNVVAGGLMRRYRRRMEFWSEDAEPSDPWGGLQPKLERLEYEAPRRFVLVGKLNSGEPIRVRLCPGRDEEEPDG
jgi:hypothetical protein